MTGELLILLAVFSNKEITKNDYNFKVTNQELQLQQTKFEFNMKKYNIKLNWQKNIF